MTTIPTLPTPPDRTAPENTFASQAAAWVQALIPWTTAANTVASEVQTNAADAADSADAAASSESAALGAANFKGNWSSLTGALNKPASVYHDGYVWLLLNNLADVTASEPGVTSDWIAIGLTEVFQAGFVDHGTISTGTVTIDWSLESVHQITAGGDFTIAFSNYPASGTYQAQGLQIIDGGSHTITLPAAVIPDNSSDVSFATGANHMTEIVFRTWDGGTQVPYTVTMEDVDLT